MKQTKRYVKVDFNGYLPADLAVQAHMVMRRQKKNIVGEDIEPLEFFEGEYEFLKEEN